MATSAKKLEELEKQVANSSEKNRNFFTATLLVLVYLAIVVLQTTDLDLLIGHGVHLPLIDVDLPMFAFYITAPLLALALHFNLLQNIEGHHFKLIKWRDAYTSQQVPRENIQPFIFDFSTLDNQSELSNAIQFVTQIVFYWSGPITILLILWRFTDYQSWLTTAWHAGLLFANLWLVMVIRKKIDGTDISKPTTTTRPSIKWSNSVKLLKYILKKLWLGCKKCFSWCVEGITKHKVSNAIGIVIWCCAAMQTVLLMCVSFGNLPNFSSIEIFTQKIEDKFLNQKPESEPISQCNTIGTLCSKTVTSYKKNHLAAPMYIPKYPSSERIFLHSRKIVELFFPRIAIDYRSNLLNLDADKLKLEFELSPAITITAADIETARKTNTRPKARKYENFYDWVMGGNGGIGLDLRERNLAFADLSRADLRFSLLENTNLSNANLSGANLDGAKLIGTQLQSSNLYFASMRTQLKDVTLQGASLKSSKLYYTGFNNVNLREADMSSTGFYGASLNSTDLTNSNLKNARLVNLSIDDKTIFNNCVNNDAVVEKMVVQNGDIATNNEIWKELAKIDQAKTNELLEKMYKQGWPKEATKTTP